MNRFTAAAAAFSAGLLAFLSAGVPAQAAPVRSFHPGSVIYNTAGTERLKAAEVFNDGHSATTTEEGVCFTDAPIPTGGTNLDLATLDPEQSDLAAGLAPAEAGASAETVSTWRVKLSASHSRTVYRYNCSNGTSGTYWR